MPCVIPSSGSESLREREKAHDSQTPPYCRDGLNLMRPLFSGSLKLMGEVTAWGRASGLEGMGRLDRVGDGEEGVVTGPKSPCPCSYFDVTRSVPEGSSCIFYFLEGRARCLLKLLALDTGLPALTARGLQFLAPPLHWGGGLRMLPQPCPSAPLPGSTSSSKLERPPGWGWEGAIRELSCAGLEASNRWAHVIFISHST